MTSGTSSVPRPVVAVASAIGIIVAVVMLPVVLIAGGPLNGWVVGLALWIANWSLQIATARWSLGANPTTAVGLSGLSFISRAWIVAGILFVIALKYDETIGLVAAGVFLAAFTADLLGRSVLFAIRQKIREESAR